MLNVKDLNVVYSDQTQALHHLSFSVKGNETIGIVGANGAGKSSLLLSLMRVIDYQGEVRIDEMVSNEKTLGTLREKMQLVFQNPDDQLFMTSVLEDIEFGLDNFGITESEKAERIQRVSEQLNITKLLNKSPLHLSGGEKRMAALAAVLVLNPEILLFDEPSAFLDPKARRVLIHTLKQLKQTKIIATHDLPLVEELCDRILVLQKGNLVYDGNPSVLYDQNACSKWDLEAIGYKE